MIPLLLSKFQVLVRAGAICRRTSVRTTWMSPVVVVINGTAQPGCLAWVAEVRAIQWLKKPLAGTLAEPPCAYTLAEASRKSMVRGSFLMSVH